MQTLKHSLLTMALALAAFFSTAGLATAETGNKNRYPEVVLYSTSWCGICARARNYFNANNIEFSEYDVETTQKGFDDFRRFGGRGVPLIFVGSRRMDGFSVARFQQLYLPLR